MKEYKSVDISIVYLEEGDCICTSLEKDDYKDNELPILPFYS